MTCGWSIVIGAWLFGVTALWDECYALLEQIPRTVRRLLRLK